MLKSYSRTQAPSTEKSSIMLGVVSDFVRCGALGSMGAFVHWSNGALLEHALLALAQCTQ